MDLFEKQIHNYQLLNQVKIKNYNTDFPYNVFSNGELLITGKTIELLVKELGQHSQHSHHKVKGGAISTITIMY
jgi:hypothetical protein